MLNRTLACFFGITLCIIPHFSANAAETDVPMTNDRGETAILTDIHLKPGTEEAFEIAVLRAVRCTRLEPGNITFNIHKVYRTDRRYVLYEIWRTPDQYRTHLDRPYIRRLVETMERTMDPPPSQSVQYLGDFAPDIRLDPLSTEPSRMQDCK